MTSDRRTGILGGTFDPIHLGHLAAAEAARRALALNRLLFVPAHHPPHRDGPTVASDYHRFAMVALAVSYCEGSVASDLELQAGGPSYTSTLLDRLHAQGLAPSQLFFIAGADAFAEIATWHNYPAVLDHCHFVVVARSGSRLEELRERLPDLASRMREAPDEARPSAQVAGSTLWIFLVNAPTPDVSSSDIRARLAAGDSIAGYVSPDVERHIYRHGLYGSLPSCGSGHRFA